MFFRILKKDIQHKRGSNFIIFLFMLMATIFVASSVNNILVVWDGTKYCMEKGKVGDLYVSTYEPEGQPALDEWLDENKELYHSYSKNEGVLISDQSVKSFGGKDGSEFKIHSNMILQHQWKENMLIYNLDKEEAQAKEGEIRLPQKVMKENHLKAGDTIEFDILGTIFSFQIGEPIIDPAFGGEYVGMIRFLINEKDFEKICETDVLINYSYNMMTDDYVALSGKINQQAFQIYITVDIGMFANTYIMPMIITGVLIVVGICLIIIAFLILRFTISFSISQDYKEIGGMKAIGIRNLMIANVYLTKYIVIVAIAAVIGCIVSIPVSNKMLQTVGDSMMLRDTNINFGINILCSMVVGLFVIGVCYLCTRKLRKVSVIDVIRNGQNGERFAKSSKLSLHKSSHRAAVVFLAINDLLSNGKRYAVLILTFIIGMLLIILPVNILSTMSSGEMAKSFMLDPKADFYMGSKAIEDELTTEESGDWNKMNQNLAAVEDKLRDKGYDVRIESLLFYTFSFYADDKDLSTKEMTMIPMNQKKYQVELIEGVQPERANEVILSDKAMKNMKVQIGDTIHVVVNNEVRDLIITGYYQSYIQMGNSVVLSSKFDVGPVKTAGAWQIQCYLKDQKMSKELLEQMRSDFPELRFYNMQEAMDTQLGNTSSYINSVKYMIVALIAVVNILITVLLIKIFILSERGQIAMLRSIGFTVTDIRVWQTVRFIFVMIISAAAGALLSIPISKYAFKPLFSYMGATHMKVTTNPLEIYCIFPIILLLVVGISAYITSGGIRKFRLMEINNQE